MNRRTLHLPKLLKLQSRRAAVNAQQATGMERDSTEASIHREACHFKIIESYYH
jgi:hypothetical protein